MTTEQELPKGWKIERLGDIAISEKGKKPKNQSSEKTDTYCYPYVDIEAFEKGVIKSYTDGVKCVLCDEDDFLMVWDGSRSGLVGKGIKGALGSTLVRISLPEVSNLYAYYFLLSKYQEINTRAKGSGTPHVDPDLLWNYAFPIPPNLETQQAIVNKIESLFDEIDEGIGRLKTAAQQIQQYRQSLLKNAFNGELTKEWRSKHADTLPSANELLAQIQTAREQHHAQQLANWQNVTIGEVVTISPKKETAIDDNTDVSFSSMHLMSSSISEHLTYEIKKWADVKKGFTVFRNNDVLLAKITPCFENGKSAVAQDLINGIGTGSTEFMVLRCSNQLLPKFLYFLVNTPDFRQAGIHNMTGSVGHKRVPKDFVSSWTFSLPSLTEQTQIVAILESKLTACDQLAAELAKQLKQAELLKQAVLKAAFSGSLLDK